MIRRTRVFVSGPLSGEQRIRNVKAALKAGRELVIAGHSPLVPHLSHLIDPIDELGYENWLQVCLAWVAVADAVLRLPGASKGADRECALALSLGIPVYVSIEALSKEQVVV